MDLKLSGTRVLVTGGTRGIGRAIVEGFLDEGAHVGFCARNTDEVTATQEALSERGTVAGSVVDVADAEALAAWVEQSADSLGGLDVVVANVSALAIPDTEENWQASLNVDLMHTVRLVRAAMPHLERSEAASIIAVSSVSGRESDFASGPYGTAKTAIIGYINGLAMQLAEQGIRANSISPGNTYFEGGVGEHRDRQPGPVQDCDGPQPDRPHGHSRGDRRPGGLPGQSPGSPDQWHQPRGGRSADPRYPAVESEWLTGVPKRSRHHRRASEAVRVVREHTSPVAQWSWRESNPRPVAPYQVFSGCSS